MYIFNALYAIRNSHIYFANLMIVRLNYITQRRRGRRCISESRGIRRVCWEPVGQKFRVFTAVPARVIRVRPCSI